jgi:predicted nucleic acid-binding protein
MSDAAVVDASALVEILLASDRGKRLKVELDRFDTIHAPAHLDAEVLSAFGRLHRAGAVLDGRVSDLLSDLAESSIQRHPVSILVNGAWGRRANLRLADALYVELAARVAGSLVTVDLRLAKVAGVSVITA